MNEGIILTLTLLGHVLYNKSGGNSNIKCEAESQKLLVNDLDYSNPLFIMIV